MTLIRRLKSLAPPSLSWLVSRLKGLEDFEEFLEIVREFVPEWEQEIMSKADATDQIAAFADRFEDRYFPLQDFMRCDAEDYRDLTSQIPVVLRSFDYDDYHDIEGLRDGLQLMIYLLEPPCEDESGARVAWAESCSFLVPIELLERVPEGGLSLGDIEPRLSNTPYEGLVDWCKALNLDTGNFFMDCTWEDLGYHWWDWGRENVDYLTEEWLKSEVILERIVKLAQWLEDDPVPHFEELLIAAGASAPTWDRRLLRLAGQMEMDLFEG